MYLKTIINVSESTAKLIEYAETLYQTEDTIIEVLKKEYGERSEVEKEFCNCLFALQSKVMKIIGEQVTGNLDASNFDSI